MKIIYFVAFVLAITCQVTLQGGLSGDPINVVLNNDTKLVNLSHQIGDHYVAVLEIAQIYELNVEQRKNVTQLSMMLEKISHVNRIIEQTQTELKFEISASLGRIFYNRVALEFLLIQSGHHLKTLKRIGMEILAEANSLTKGYPRYVNSETLLIANQLMASKFVSLLGACFTADKLIHEAFAKSGAIDRAAKEKITQQFQIILADVKGAKGEFASDFYEEVEKLRLEGTELALLQKMLFEVSIDMLNYLSGFVTKFEELFLHIVT